MKKQRNKYIFLLFTAVVILLLFCMKKYNTSITNLTTSDTYNIKKITGENTIQKNTSPAVNFMLNNDIDNTTYGISDTIPFTIRADPPLEFYGYWEKVKNIKSDFMSTCTACQHVVASNEDRVIHGLQSGHTGYTVRTKGNASFDANVWHADNTPCSIVYHITLPEGLEIVEDNISVAQLSEINTLLDAVDASKYQTFIEERSLTIKITDIKTDSFGNVSKWVSYQPIVASFSAKLTDSASSVNLVNASVSFNQGKYSKTISTNTVTINRK